MLSNLLRKSADGIDEVSSKIKIAQENFHSSLKSISDPNKEIKEYIEDHLDKSRNLTENDLTSSEWKTWKTQYINTLEYILQKIK